MESSAIFKFWRNTTTAADVISNVSDVSNSMFGTDDEFTDDDDSLFDLEINSRNAENSNKDFQFIESPRDVFLTKNDFSNSKPSSPISFPRSTPKLKFILFGFRKSPSSSVKPDSASEPKASQLNQLSKLSKTGQSSRFEAPVTPVLARENSLRRKLLKESSDYEYDLFQDKSVPKYAKLVKHFSPKRSKNANVTGSVSPLSSSSISFSPRKFSEGSRMNSFKMVSKNLRKSHSASAVVGAAAPLLRRRDDCLLDDGIQGAILHCKKSLDATSSQEFPQLSRSASDPSEKKY